ncbi:FPR1, partial [Symbiodinium natans]
VKTLRCGDGVTFPKPGDKLHTHYVGRIAATGEQIDSSYERGLPFRFQLGVGQVIAGWDEGIRKMSLGEHALLMIPSDRAYGVQGAGGSIPPDTDLVFEACPLLADPLKFDRRGFPRAAGGDTSGDDGAISDASSYAPECEPWYSIVLQGEDDLMIRVVTPTRKCKLERGYQRGCDLLQCGDILTRYPIGSTLQHDILQKFWEREQFIGLGEDGGSEASQWVVATREQYAQLWLAVASVGLNRPVRYCIAEDEHIRIGGAATQVLVMAPVLIADAAPESAAAWKSKKRFYKQTRLCSFNLVGACKRGSACNFAHSEIDLKEMPDFSKTRICKNFMAGKCELGSACSFAHGQQELIQAKKANKKSKAALVAAELHEEQLRHVVEAEKPVKALKEFLAAPIGYSRFRQRLFVEDMRELKEGQTACYLAAGSGHMELLRLLVAADEDSHTQSGTAALLMAARGGHLDVVRRLLEAGVVATSATRDGEAALHVAAECGHLEVAELLNSWPNQHSSAGVHGPEADPTPDAVKMKVGSRAIRGNKSDRHG